MNNELPSKNHNGSNTSPDNRKITKDRAIPKIVFKDIDGEFTLNLQTVGFEDSDENHDNPDDQNYDESSSEDNLGEIEQQQPKNPYVNKVSW